MMRITWRDEQHPSFINFISNFLTTNSFRLNFVAIPPVISSVFLFVISIYVKQIIKGSLVHHSLNSVMVAIAIALQDFIFNCGGLSVAFIFVTSLDSTNVSQIFGR